MAALLQISCKLWQWKNFENRREFDQVMCRVLAYFLATLYIQFN